MYIYMYMYWFGHHDVADRRRQRRLGIIYLLIWSKAYCFIPQTWTKTNHNTFGYLLFIFCLYWWMMYNVNIIYGKTKWIGMNWISFVCKSLNDIPWVLIVYIIRIIITYEFDICSNKIEVSGYFDWREAWQTVCYYVCHMFFFLDKGRVLIDMV